MSSGKIEVMYCDEPDCKKFFTIYCKINPDEGGEVLPADGSQRQPSDISGFQCKCCKKDLCVSHVRTVVMNSTFHNNGEGYTFHSKFGPFCISCQHAVRNLIDSGKLNDIITLFLEKRREKLVEDDEDFVASLRRVWDSE